MVGGCRDSISVEARQADRSERADRTSGEDSERISRRLSDFSIFGDEETEKEREREKVKYEERERTDARSARSLNVARVPAGV